MTVLPAGTLLILTNPARDSLDIHIVPKRTNALMYLHLAKFRENSPNCMIVRGTGTLRLFPFPGYCCEQLPCQVKLN
jgi:hypothetical protein